MRVSLWHQQPGLKPPDTLAGRIAAATHGTATCRMWIGSSTRTHGISANRL